MNLVLSANDETRGFHMPAPGFWRDAAGVHRSTRDQEAVMKSMARAILFSGFVAATTAAVGDKLSGAMGERENGQEAASSAQADPQASDPTMSVESAASTEGAATSPDAVPQPSEYATVTPSPSTDIVAAVPPPPAESVARRVPA